MIILITMMITITINENILCFYYNNNGNSDNKNSINSIIPIIINNISVTVNILVHINIVVVVVPLYNFQVYLLPALLSLSHSVIHLHSTRQEVILRLIQRGAYHRRRPQTCGIANLERGTRARPRAGPGPGRCTAARSAAASAE